MKFRLVESVNRRFTNDYDKHWKELDNVSMDEKVSTIMRDYMLIDDPQKFKELYGMIGSSIESHSLDPDKNSFLSYLLTLSNVNNMNSLWGDENVLRNIETLRRRATIRGEKLDNEWYYDDKLLKSPNKDFEYTINIADVLNDPNKLEKYFNNIENKGIENIYKEGSVALSSTVKDAGLNSNDPETIYGMISKWTREDGKESKNDSGTKVTIRDFIKKSFPKTPLPDIGAYKDAILELLNKYSKDFSPEALTVLQYFFKNKQTDDATRNILKAVLSNSSINSFLDFLKKNYKKISREMS